MQSAGVSGGVKRGILLVAAALLVTAHATAQPRDAGRPAGWVDPLDDQSVDGLDVTTPAAALPPPRRGAAVRTPPIVGEVLTAVSGVREIEHTVAVRLEQGLAFVTATVRLTSRVTDPDAVVYRLAVPAGATLARIEACVGQVCRRADATDGLGAGVGTVDAVAGPPAIVASRVTTERGDAFELHASPVVRNADLLLRVEYVATAPFVGGVARVDIPARGTDPRVVPAVVTVQAPGLLAPTVDGSPADARPVAIDAWFPIPVAATAPTRAPATASAIHVPCGTGTCMRIHALAGPARGGAVDLVLLIDSSPSTQGPVRGRIAAATAALLASLPPGSQVRAAAFAGRARSLVEVPVSSDHVELAPILSVEAGELGSATRFEAAWELIRPWLSGARRGAPRPELVIMGDGGLTEGAGATAAFSAARRAGVSVSVVDVGDRSPNAALARGVDESGGMVVNASAEADEAARGHEAGRLEERLAALFAPTVAPQVMLVSGAHRTRLGELRAGEQVSWEGAMPRGAVVEVAGRRVVPRAAPAELANALARRLGRVTRAASPDEHDPRRAAALARPTSLPSEPLLTVLRQRVVPVARGCFRTDRAGRANYRARAEFEFRLADREVVEADVRGRIAPELRECLLEAVDRLEVPRFDGSVVVRYPLVTQPEMPPPVLDLAPALADRVDTIGHD